MFLPSPCFLFTSLSQLSDHDHNLLTKTGTLGQIIQNDPTRRIGPWRDLSLCRFHVQLMVVSCRFPCSGHHPLWLSNLSWRTIATQLKKSSDSQVEEAESAFMHVEYLSNLVHALSTCQPLSILSTRLSAPFPRVHENLWTFDKIWSNIENQAILTQALSQLWRNWSISEANSHWSRWRCSWAVGHCVGD